MSWRSGEPILVRIFSKVTPSWMEYWIHGMEDSLVAPAPPLKGNLKLKLAGTLQVSYITDLQVHLIENGDRRVDVEPSHFLCMN